MRKTAGHLATTVVLALTIACTSQPAFSVRTLPSGRQIKILALARMDSKEDGPALLLKYQTDNQIDDRRRVTSEIDEIFGALKFDCERANMRTCMISANEPPHGWIITKNRAFNAVFVQSNTGEWKKMR